MNDILRAFHHPALRDESIEIQRDMFKTVRMWADQHPRRHDIDRILSSESVKQGKNHVLNQQGGSGKREMGGGHGCGGDGGHGKVAGSLWSQVRTRDFESLQGKDGDASANYISPSPAPPGSHSPPSGGYNYNQGGSGSYQGNNGPPPGGYNAPPSQPYYQGGGGGYNQGPPPGPPQGYGGPAPGYGAPPPGSNYGGGPPPPQQQWNAPPQGYGGPGYGPPQGYGGPPQGQYPPYQQGPPPPQGPPSWSSYPGQGGQGQGY